MTPKNEERIEFLLKGTPKDATTNIENLIKFIKEADANAEEYYLKGIEEMKKVHNLELVKVKLDTIGWVKEQINNLMSCPWAINGNHEYNDALEDFLEILDAQAQDNCLRVPENVTININERPETQAPPTKPELVGTDNNVIDLKQDKLVESPLSDTQDSYSADNVPSKDKIGENIKKESLK